jgi:hypothetical protein
MILPDTEFNINNKYAQTKKAKDIISNNNLKNENNPEMNNIFDLKNDICFEKEVEMVDKSTIDSNKNLLRNGNIKNFNPNKSKIENKIDSLDNDEFNLIELRNENKRKFYNENLKLHYK